MKKSEYDDLHEEKAERVVEEIFCPMCTEHESLCIVRYSKDDRKRCFTAGLVKRKIKKIFDKYDNPRW